MKKYSVALASNSVVQKLLLFLIAATLVMTCISRAGAQKDKKKKKDQPSAESSKFILPLTDEQQVDYMLSEMLGAWQLGDLQKMHTDYSDDVSLVHGSWQPPVIGWTNYAASYQQQRTRMQQVRFERSNTLIKVVGNFGWACYQWEFSGLVDGQQVNSLGHTTVVVEKRNDHWIIVHNHTSAVLGAPPATPAKSPQPQQPTQPNGS